MTTLPGKIRRARRLCVQTACLAFAVGGCERGAAKPGEAELSAHTHGDGHAHNAGADSGTAGGTTATEWCIEHNVPEKDCTRCNPALIARFKAAGDWCAGHGVPESQCLICNPELAAKFDAMRPKSAGRIEPDEDRGLRVEPASDSLRPENDPLCDVESRIVRLLDPSIARKAGIRVEQVAPQRLSTAITRPAEVRYDQTRLARITPRADGIMAAVNVDLGSKVYPGDVLAIVDSPAIGQAKAAYIDAFQRRAITQADLDRHNQIHTGIENMLAACCRESSTVDLREQYAEVRIGDYKSRLLNAHSQLELVHKRFEREQSLLDRGITSQESFQSAKRDLEQAEADFAATHEAIDIEMEKEHVSLDRALRIADVTVDAARRNLRILGIGDEDIEALAAGADDEFSRYGMAVPIEGRVVRRDAVVGEAVSTHDVLFAVADTTSLWLLLSLEERDMATVRTGQRVMFTVDGAPGRHFEGSIDWISSEVAEPSRTITARVPLDNAAGLLRANMFGEARVIVHDQDEVLTVPESAVQTDGCCNIVFVKESETVFRPRTIVPGTTSRGVIEVIDGLAAGDAVVTAGSFLLKTEILKSNIGAGCCEVNPGR